MKHIFLFLVAALVLLPVFSQATLPKDKEWQAAYRVINAIDHHHKKYNNPVKTVGPYIEQVDLNYVYNNKTLLGYAVTKEAFSMVKILIAAGADPDYIAEGTTGGTALQIALKQKNKKIAYWIATHGSDLSLLSDRQFKTLYAYAMSRNGGVLILKMIDEGLLDVNTRNMNIPKGASFKNSSAYTLEQTPLMEASWNGNSALVAELLKRKADVHLKTPRGHTAISRAVGYSGNSFYKKKAGDPDNLLDTMEHDYKSVVAMLREAGAQLDGFSARRYGVERFKAPRKGFWKKVKLLMLRTVDGFFGWLLLILVISVSIWRVKTSHHSFASERGWAMLAIGSTALIMGSQLVALLLPDVQLYMADHFWCSMVFMSARISGTCFALLALAIVLFRWYDSIEVPEDTYTSTSVHKSCGNCGKGVSSAMKAGDVCPHCGVVWGHERFN